MPLNNTAILKSRLQTLLIKLCSFDFSEKEQIEYLPFFWFHYNFKKAVLENLLIELVEENKVKKQELQKVVKEFENSKYLKQDPFSLSIPLNAFKSKEGLDTVKLCKYLKTIEKTVFSTKDRKVVDFIYSTEIAGENTDGLTIPYINKQLGEFIESETDLELEDVDIATIKLDVVDVFDFFETSHFWYFEDAETKSPKSGVIENFLIYHKKSKKTHQRVINEGEKISNTGSFSKDRNFRQEFVECFKVSELGVSPAQKELLTYFENTVNVGFSGFEPKTIENILFETFEAMQKLYFCMVISENLNKTTKGELAQLLHILPANFSEFTGLFFKTMPKLPQISLIAEALNLSTDTLLGLDSEKSVVLTDETAEDFCLEKETLDYLRNTHLRIQKLEQTKDFDDTYKILVDKYKVLNLLLRSTPLHLNSIAKNSPYYIDLDKEVLFELKQLEGKIEKIKRDKAISERVLKEKGIRVKILNDIELRYTPSWSIITKTEKNKVAYKVLQRKASTEYQIYKGVPKKVVIRVSATEVNILCEDVNNYIYLDPDEAFDLIELAANCRSTIVGTETTNVLDPLLEFLAKKNQAVFCFSEKELKENYDYFLLQQEQGLRISDRFDVDQFIQSIKEDVDLTGPQEGIIQKNYQQDELLLMKITNRLKNLKLKG